MKHNWPTLLAQYINQNRNTPFTWGTFDCCLFAANAVEVMTGHDYAKAFRGHYTTELGAAKALKRYGAGSLESTLIQLLGPASPGLSFQRGDVCLVENQGLDTVGIFFNSVVWAPAQSGLVAISANQIIKHWSNQTWQQ